MMTTDDHERGEYKRGENTRDREREREKQLKSPKKSLSIYTHICSYTILAQADQISLSVATQREIHLS